MKTSKLFILSVAALFMLNCLPALSVSAEDFTDIGPYIAADVPHRKVVTYAAKKDVPVALASKVVQTYPGGRMKAVIMTTDDCPSTNDRTFIIPTLRTYGLTACFNTVVKNVLLSQNSDLRELYEGMEAGNHTYDHRTLESQNKQGYRRQLGDSKRLLEETIGREVAGYIPGSNGNPALDDPVPDTPSGAWRENYLKYTGFRYVKLYQAVSNPWTGNNTKPSSLVYSVPSNFYNWLPTMELQAKLDDGSNPADVCAYYVDQHQNTSLSLLFYNTHANGGFDAGTSARVNFTALCEKLGANKATVWNVTPMDYVDYMNALWNTTGTLKEDSTGITATNTSGEMDVFLTINGVNTLIPHGKAVTVDAGGTIVATKDVQMVYGLPESRSLFEALNPHVMVDGASTNRVTVEGNIGSEYAGAEVSLIMVPTETDMNLLSDADIDYIWQDKVDADGKYSFNFEFSGLTFDKLGVATNYKIYLNHGGMDVTPTVTLATADRTVIRYSWDVTEEADVAKAVIAIDNAIGLNNQSYMISLACYSADNVLLGVEVSKGNDMVTGLMNDSLSLTLPQGTDRVKAFIFDNTDKLMPLAKAGQPTPGK